MTYDINLIDLLIRGALAFILFLVIILALGAVSLILDNLFGDTGERVRDIGINVDERGISNSEMDGTASNIQTRPTPDDSTAWPELNWRPKFQELPRTNTADNSARRNGE